MRLTLELIMETIDTRNITSLEKSTPINFIFCEHLFKVTIYICTFPIEEILMKQFVLHTLNSLRIYNVAQSETINHGHKDGLV